MATPDQIPSDLALEIGDNLSPERFMSAARAFFGYVEEVGRILAPEGEQPTWTVLVRQGSNIIGVQPTPTAPIEVVRQVYARVSSSVRSLADGDIEDSGLTETAMRHLRALSELAQADKSKPVQLNIWVEKRPIAVAPEIGEVIREDTRADYHDYGTVEGRLEAIQDHGGLELRIRDALLRLTVRCSVPEYMLAEAFASFRKRVEVSGLVHFRRNGTPVSIEASKIEPLPDDNDLPSPQDVRGILRALA